MSSSIIIYPIYLAGGIGDILRAALSFYVFAKRHNIPFYFDFSAIPGLRNCFEYPKFDYNSNYNPIVHIEFVGGFATRDNQVIQQIYDRILNEPANYRITSNIFGFESWQDISASLSTFPLKPSKQVEERIQEIINEKNYISVHIRCGDVYMSNKSAQYCLTDRRISLNLAFIDDFLEKVMPLVENSNKTVIVHCDNDIFKDLLRKKTSFFTILNLKIQHSALRPETSGDNTGYIDTIAEFYILTRASTIIQYNYSGFSHWASVLGGNELLYFEEHDNLRWTSS